MHSTAQVHAELFSAIEVAQCLLGVGSFFGFRPGDKERRKKQRKLAMLAMRKTQEAPFIKSLQQQLRVAKDETGTMKHRAWKEQCQKVAWKRKHDKMGTLKEFFERRLETEKNTHILC